MLRFETQGVKREARNVRREEIAPITQRLVPGSSPRPQVPGPQHRFDHKGASPRSPFPTISRESRNLLAPCLKPPAHNIALITQALAHAAASPRQSSEALVRILNCNAQRLASSPCTRLRRQCQR